MALFEVDAAKCKRDNICIQECPLRIIEMKNTPDAVPTPVLGAEEICIDCGHCVAVCPHGALSHRAMTPEDCPPVNKEWVLDDRQAEHFLRYRRSIRTFKKQPVDKEKIERLIEIAKYAPSGHNRQPVNWHVVYDTQELNRLNHLVVDWMRHMIKTDPKFAEFLHLELVVAGFEMGIDTICREAPHLIIAHGSSADMSAQNACVIAMTYLELAAPSLGLGPCWAGFFNAAANFWPPLKEAIEIPAENNCFGAMMIGYPKFKYHRFPLRNPAKVSWQ